MAKITRICHATFDDISYRFYFTGCPLQAGIWWISLEEILDNNKFQNAGTLALKYLVEPRSSHPKREFWGISSVGHLLVLACCHRKPNTIGLWSSTLADGDTGSSRLLIEICFNDELCSEIRLPFTPFRCTTFVTKSNSIGCWNVTIAIGDYTHSRLHFVGVRATKDQINRSMCRFEKRFEHIFATKGVQIGAVQNPDGLHFDPEGRLFVADSGNLRIQACLIHNHSFGESTTSF